METMDILKSLRNITLTNEVDKQLIDELEQRIIELETIKQAASDFIIANNYLRSYNTKFSSNDIERNDVAYKQLQALLNKEIQD